MPVSEAQTGQMDFRCLASLGTLALLGSAVPATANSCMPSPYIVLFAWQSAELSRQTKETLDNAKGTIASVLASPDCGVPRILLSAHTDNSERASVARARMNAVRRYLTRNGIDNRRISAQSFGSAKLRVPTPANTREPQNRRVEIYLMPQGGKLPR